jgi:hypothetical protein
MVSARENASDLVPRIAGSSLGCAEKTLFVIEWILRDYKVYALFEMKPKEIRHILGRRLKECFSDDFMTSTMSEIRTALSPVGNADPFDFVVALAYFLYVDDEFVYDTSTREWLLSKEKSFGFSVSEVQTLLANWTKVFGNPTTLFERFLKSSE